jgi:hypothetical protein
MNRSPLRGDNPIKREVRMANILQWIVLAFGIGVIALGASGFSAAFRSLRNPPNTAHTAKATTGVSDRGRTPRAKANMVGAA